MSSIVKATPASCAMASRWSTVLVEPPIATSRAIAFSKASNVAMLRGKTVASPLDVVPLRHVDDEAARALEELPAHRVGREQRAVAGEGEADGLVQAVHAVRGEHARARAARRARGALDVREIGVASPARRWTRSSGR